MQCTQSLWQYLTEFFLDADTFQVNVAQKTKAY
jgi:hypothetical protein